MSSDIYYVEVLDWETRTVVKGMGPMSARKADKVDAGLNRNLNHDKFFTRVRSTADVD